MADFTSIGISKDDGQALCGKFEAFVSISGKTSQYETVGVVRNEQTFNMTPEFIEYKDGFSDWALTKASESYMMEGAFMQWDVKLLAIAMGRPSITSTSSVYDDLLLSSTRIAPPAYRWKFVGETLDGKDIEIEFLKGQIKSEVSLTLNSSDFAEIPFTIQATKMDSSTYGYDVARVRVQR